MVNTGKTQNEQNNNKYKPTHNTKLKLWRVILVFVGLSIFWYKFGNKSKF